MKLGPITKPDKRNKTSKKFDNGVISPNFCKINPENSKIKAILGIKGIFFKTAYVCILTYQISSFYHNSNNYPIFRWGNPPPSKQTPKNPTQIRVNLSSSVHF